MAVIAVAFVVFLSNIIQSHAVDTLVEEAVANSSGLTLHVTPEILDATPGGFEPPISTVTGWHVCPLHHGAILVR